MKSFRVTKNYDITQFLIKKLDFQLTVKLSIVTDKIDLGFASKSIKIIYKRALLLFSHILL